MGYRALCDRALRARAALASLRWPRCADLPALASLLSAASGGLRSSR
jgi:hypothetical protein